MRICIPAISGRRGAGLGNELFPWAKAFLASTALDATMTHPAWGLNARGYHRDFCTGRLDWLRQGATRLVLPTIDFDEQAFRATGMADYDAAVAAFAAERGLARRRHFVFRTSGMWGGFHAIRKARVFVLAELLKARGAVQNVHAVLSQVPAGKSLVAVHIRRGDFQNADAGTDWRGRFNVALPLAWYLATCTAIRRACGDAVQFLLLTDAASGEVQPFIDAFSPLTTFGLRQTACSDLLLLAFADSMVCSVSSYSMWGAFLSQAPYLWFAPNLQDHDGYGSLWGHEIAQQAPGSITARSLARIREKSAAFATLDAGRGMPVDAAGTVPDTFCAQLMASTRARDVEHDLLLYGAVKLPCP
jgi:hypothetical protein